jgi:hypothetical protein
MSVLSVAADAAFGAGWLSFHLNSAAALSASVLSGMARVASAVPGGNIEVPKWDILQCAAWYAALATALLILRRLTMKRNFLV